MKCYFCDGKPIAACSDCCKRLCLTHTERANGVAKCASCKDSLYIYIDGIAYHIEGKEIRTEDGVLFCVVPFSIFSLGDPSIAAKTVIIMLQGERENQDKLREENERLRNILTQYRHTIERQSIVRAQE